MGEPMTELETGGTLKVEWQYDTSRDTEFDISKWDFVVLHREDRPFQEYDASRWLHTGSGVEKKGFECFTAPLEPGRYVFTVVRDCKLVLAVMSTVMPFKTMLRRIEDYRQKVKESHFNSTIDIRNQREDLRAIGSVSFTVKAGVMALLPQASRVVAGSTGPDPRNWADPPFWVRNDWVRNIRNQVLKDPEEKEEEEEEEEAQLIDEPPSDFEDMGMLTIQDEGSDPLEAPQASRLAAARQREQCQSHGTCALSSDAKWAGRDEAPPAIKAAG